MASMAASLPKVMSDEESLRLLVDLTGAGPEDSMLDVACGPGQVVFAFSGIVRHATGIDIDPVMIGRAREIEEQTRICNTTWGVGDSHALPFADASFSLVTCRYAMHHFREPHRVVEEMARVCMPGGRLALVDTVTDPERAELFNATERLLEPSTVRVLTFEELFRLAIDTGLRNLARHFYLMEMELDTLLRESLSKPEDVPRVRQVVMDNLDREDLGIDIHRAGNEMRVVYPIAVIVGDKTV
jgi:ubiquinone/menaquinone biosynthesis C-methylase UbiE